MEAAQKGLLKTVAFEILPEGPVQMTLSAEIGFRLVGVGGDTKVFRSSEITFFLIFPSPEAFGTQIFTFEMDRSFTVRLGDTVKEILSFPALL